MFLQVLQGDALIVGGEEPLVECFLTEHVAAIEQATVVTRRENG